MAREENKHSRYIRERIHQAREEAGMSQDDLAKAIFKNRVTISDIERGRVGIDAVDLMLIAANLRKPISYFIPEIRSINVSGDLSAIEQELLVEFRRLPDTQQYIALETIQQQRKMVDKALARQADEEAQKIFLYGDEGLTE